MHQPPRIDAVRFELTMARDARRAEQRPGSVEPVLDPQRWLLGPSYGSEEVLTSPDPAMSNLSFIAVREMEAT